jgi:Pyridoxamine 5'-phosphate oxidase
MAAVLGARERAVLGNATRAFLFANRRDGRPTGWPMTLLWRGDDHLYFNTYRKSVKAMVLRRDPRVGVVVCGTDRWLGVTGDAELLDQDLAAPMFPGMVRTDGFVSEEQAATTVQRLQDGKRGLFRIAPRTLEWLA